MLFRGKNVCFKKYLALTDTSPLVLTLVYRS